MTKFDRELYPNKLCTSSQYDYHSSQIISISFNRRHHEIITPRALKPRERQFLCDMYCILCYSGLRTAWVFEYVNAFNIFLWSKWRENLNFNSPRKLILTAIIWDISNLFLLLRNEKDFTRLQQKTSWILFSLSILENVFLIHQTNICFKISTICNTRFIYLVHSFKWHIW